MSAAKPARYAVTWMLERSWVTAQVYYQGWWHQYGEPTWCLTIKDALPMSRAGAYKAAARLRDPKRWGVDARVMRLPD